MGVGKKTTISTGSRPPVECVEQHQVRRGGHFFHPRETAAHHEEAPHGGPVVRGARSGQLRDHDDHGHRALHAADERARGAARCLSRDGRAPPERAHGREEDGGGHDALRPHPGRGREVPPGLLLPHAAARLPRDHPRLRRHALHEHAVPRRPRGQGARPRAHPRHRSEIGLAGGHGGRRGLVPRSVRPLLSAGKQQSSHIPQSRKGRLRIIIINHDSSRKQAFVYAFHT